MTIFIIIALIIFIIWLVKNKSNIENEEKMKQISGELRVKFPNFVRAIRKINGNNATLHADNNKAISYKVAVSTFQRHMGDLFFSLIDNSNIYNKPYTILVYKGFDGIEVATEKHYLTKDEDLKIEEYEAIFLEHAKEIMVDSRYLNSVSFFD